MHSPGRHEKIKQKKIERHYISTNKPKSLESINFNTSGKMPKDLKDTMHDEMARLSTKHQC
jgi:hypothetical protein